MHQIIVSIVQVGIAAGGEMPIRPFRWVSSSDTDLEVMLDKINKLAIKDMNTTPSESDDIVRIVRKVFDRQEKNYSIRFNSGETLRIEIRDEADIAARRAEVDQLMFGNKANN